MERRIINPWTWQDGYGFVQANEIAGPARVLYCAGQASVDSEGRVAHAGDIRAQLVQSLTNVEAVLTAAGFSLADVVRLNYYTVDVDGLFANWDAVTTRFAQTGCRPTSTLLGVARLAFPDLLVEIEATAVRKG